MTKKIISVAAITLGLGLALTACSSSSSDDLSGTRDDVVKLSAEVKAKYNLGFVDDLSANAVKLDNTTVVDESSDHYTVYVSNDYASTMFTYSYALDDFLKENGDHSKTISAKVMGFGSVYTSEESSISSLLYDATNGLPQYKDAVGFDVDTTKSFTQSYSFSTAVTAYEAGVRNITFDTVYIPVVVVRHYDSRDVLKAVLFAPMYSSFNSDGKLIASDGTAGDASATEKYSKIDVDFEDNGQVKTGETVIA